MMSMSKQYQKADTLLYIIGVARGGAQGARASPSKNSTNDQKIMTT